MSASYEVHVHTDVGVRLLILSQPIISLESVRAVNTVGTLAVTVPFGVIPDSYIQFNFIILVWRSIDGNTRQIMNQTLYYMQRWTHRDRDGNKTTTIECVDALHLLRRRLIAYYAGSAEAQKAAAPADDQMKAFVRENLASTASDYAGATDRGLSATTLTVEPDLSLGASIAKAAAWRVLYDVLRELADASRTAGTWLAFDLIPVAGQGLNFRVFRNQRGIDRRVGANAVLISEASGTLIESELITDYSEVATHVYAGGPGEMSNRIIGTASNTALVQSVSGRVEDWTTGYQGTTQAYVTDEAEAALTLRRPRQTATGQIQQSTSLIWGRDIDFGDYVRAQMFGIVVDARLDGVQTTLDSSGQETILVALRSETVL